MGNRQVTIRTGSTVVARCKRLLVLPVALALCSAVAAQVPEYEATLLDTFSTFDARQGIAVDERHFFAINNARVTQHDKRTGEAVLQWDGGVPEGIDETLGRLIHLDSGMVHDGLLYAAHSNYPGWPMTSSVEMWDADTLEHVGSHSFGVLAGSLTWIDWHEGHWWAAFGNYDRVQPGMDQPYGTTAATTLVQLDAQFNILQQWVYPPALHERFTPMSNSGGSWGADGFLYITGHDHPEVYVVRVPEQGSEVEWLATVHLPEIEGQGIAWDRSSEDRVLWGILKRREQVFRFAIPHITDLAEPHPGSPLREAGQFNRD